MADIAQTSRLYLVVGPSGTGKSTLVNRLVAEVAGCRAVRSITTRPRRDHEVEGVDYFFVDDDEFDRLDRDGELLQKVVYRGNKYGSTRHEVEHKLAAGDVFFVIEGEGARRMKALFGDRARIMFLVPPPVEALRERLVARKDTPEAIAARLDPVAYAAECAYQADADWWVYPDTPDAVFNLVRERIQMTHQPCPFLRPPRGPDAGP